MKKCRIKIVRQNTPHQFLISFIVLPCVICVLTFSWNFIFSQAKSSEQINYYKYYKSIVIRPGDSLTGISNQYMTYPYEDREKYIDEIIQINAISKDNIKAGNFIIIPYYSTVYKE